MYGTTSAESAPDVAVLTTPRARKAASLEKTFMWLLRRRSNVGVSQALPARFAFILLLPPADIAARARRATTRHLRRRCRFAARRSLRLFRLDLAVHQIIPHEKAQEREPRRRCLTLRAQVSDGVLDALRVRLENLRLGDFQTIEG